jgi:hypothetical protein
MTTAYIEQYVETLSHEQLLDACKKNGIADRFTELADDNWPDHEDELRVKLMDKMIAKHRRIDTLRIEMATA